MALRRVLELGVGMNPQPTSTERHDRIKHSPFVDVAWDLNETPWPWKDEEWDSVVGIDVFEHLKIEVGEWLDECWRILVPHGSLTMRLPAWDNPLSYRDPTHQRIFHEESFLYWDPNHPLFHDFGRYYFQESNKWWTQVNVMREANDLKYVLQKRTENSSVV